MLTDDANAGKLRNWLCRPSVGERTPQSGARGDTTPRRWAASAGRILRLVVLILAAVASLLTFPAGMPWMVAAWLTAFTWRVLIGRRAIWCLAVPTVVLLIKRVDWAPGLWLVFGVFTLVSVARPMMSSGRARVATQRLKLAAIVAVWLAWLGLACDWHRIAHANHAVRPFDKRPIVCVGDSLTASDSGDGYPEVLASLVNVPVINLGQPGITSAEAFKKLPALRAARPQAVIIELGGHDFLKDNTLLKTRSRAATKENLARFITAARELNAEAILIEIPRAFVSDPFAGLERELAREYDIELIPDTVIREFVLYSPYAPPGMWTGGPHLSDDGLHPNARGNERLARRVAVALERLYGPVFQAPSADRPQLPPTTSR